MFGFHANFHGICTSGSFGFGDDDSWHALGSKITVNMGEMVGTLRNGRK